MKLSELEERARQEQEEAASLASKQEAERQRAAAEAAEEFRQEVVAWMVEDDLDATELEEVVSVVDHNRRKLLLRVPQHSDITFQLIWADEGFAVRDGQFYVERACEGYGQYCYSLSEALLAASEEWDERMSRGAEEIHREREREARRELRDREAAERGAEYLALLDEHPILRPILDILGVFMKERERFEHEWEMADEFAEHLEARYQEKLQQAQHEADRASSERDDLQRDLWDAQDELRKQQKGRGW